RVTSSDESEFPDFMKWHFYYPRAMQLIAEGHYWSARRIIRKHLAVLQKYRAAKMRENKDAEDANENNAEIVALLQQELILQDQLAWSYYKQNRYRKVRNLTQTIAHEHNFALSDHNDFSYAVSLTGFQAWANNHLRRYATTILVSRAVLNEYSKRKRLLTVSDESLLAQLFCERAEAYWHQDQVEMAMCDCDDACQALAPFAHKGFYYIDIILLRVFLLRARLAAACDLTENTRDDLKLAAELLEALPADFRPKEVQTFRADFEFLRSWLDKDDKE
ncbi:MAG: hypothetical protein Q4G59_11045, partial [Planctomycetia bacterium]|nr:hypothetical protein [Planctomycetia bacterium]